VDSLFLCTMFVSRILFGRIALRVCTNKMTNAFGRIKCSPPTTIDPGLLYIFSLIDIYSKVPANLHIIMMRTFAFKRQIVITIKDQAPITVCYHVQTIYIYIYIYKKVKFCQKTVKFLYIFSLHVTWFRHLFVLFYIFILHVTWFRHLFVYTYIYRSAKD
jgi:hypothetical protein